MYIYTCTYDIEYLLFVFFGGTYFSSPKLTICVFNYPYIFTELTYVRVTVSVYISTCRYLLCIVFLCKKRDCSKLSRLLSAGAYGGLGIKQTVHPLGESQHHNDCHNY